jgi:hypothetical protein
MIRYDLKCDRGHEFDGWFSTSEAFDSQAKRGYVECAHCGSSNVEKQVMAPNVGVRSNKKGDTRQRMASVLVDPRLQAMMQAAREMRQHVEENSDNVGDRFAEEARRMHYNETEKRGIHGKASLDDARELLEEGIDVLPLPQIPEDTN